MNLGLENETIEYKKSTSELKAAMDSIVAILNKHNKGILYFGVKNSGEVIGQDVSDKTLRDISQSIANHIEPKIYPNINVVQLDDLSVITVEFEGYDTPYLSYGVGKIRVADEDRSMDVKELIKYIKNKTSESDWEKQVSDKNIDSVNVEDLKDYLSKAMKVKRINFEFSDVESSLDKLSLIKDNKLLNAGMVLFSESLYSELQMAVFATDQRLTFLDIDRKRGNIFDLVNTAEDYIKRNINWRVEFDGSMERKEIPEIPIEAIREALINSFAHKDYGTCQTNEVAIYKNRVEIYNPGTFPNEHNPEDYINGNLRPIRRNPLIASILYYSRDMESFGTGLKRISDLCKKTNCKYEFEKQKYGFVVKFFRHNLIGAPNYDGDSGKMTMLKQMIVDYIASNHRMMIVSQFVQALNEIEMMLKELDIPYFVITGSVDAKKRMKICEKFNNDSKEKIVLVSLKAGGTGINLIGADTVIHLDPWWNIAATDQATDRTYRIGQKRNVEVIKLICENSIEQRVIELQNFKKDLIEKVISDNDSSVTNASIDDIKFILN